MRFTALEIATATGGSVAGPPTVCDGASIDTRTIGVGELFIPLVDDRDGHDFIDVAVAAGASAYLTDREPRGGTAIIVHDTREALTALGRAARDRHDGPVIGITGSVGKTSVKDLTAAAIGSKYKVHASERSFNNELGVPLTLIGAPEGTEVLIVEMGARGLGHIADLCEIARPTIGLVTWVGPVHTSEFGTIAAVAQAKSELIEALSEDGRAILNADCPPVAEMAAKSAAPVMTYGVAGDITATDVSVDAELRPSFMVVSYGRKYAAMLPVHGTHQVSNALAAIAAAEAVGVPTGQAITGLADATLSPWRMELRHTASGATIINDAYNANPVSTSAALQSLATLEASRRIAVLGVMAELGDRHDKDHRRMADLCAELGIDLIPYQERAYGFSPADDFDTVLRRIGEIGADDAVLIKGSRVAELENLVALLTD